MQNIQVKTAINLPYKFGLFVGASQEVPLGLEPTLRALQQQYFIFTCVITHPSCQKVGFVNRRGSVHFLKCYSATSVALLPRRLQLCQVILL